MIRIDGMINFHQFTVGNKLVLLLESVTENIVFCGNRNVIVGCVRGNKFYRFFSTETMGSES